MGILNYSAALNQAPDSVGRTLGAAGQMQGLQAQRQNMDFQRQNQEEGQAQRLAQQQQQAQAQQQEQAARQQGAELLQTGTPEQIAKYMILNPSTAKDFISAANFQDEAAIAAIRFLQERSESADRVFDPTGLGQSIEVLFECKPPLDTKFVAIDDIEKRANMGLIQRSVRVDRRPDRDQFNACFSVGSRIGFEFARSRRVATDVPRLRDTEILEQ